MSLRPGVPSEFQLVVRRRCKVDGCDESMEGRAPNAGKCLVHAGAAIPKGTPTKRGNYERWRHGKHYSLGF